MRLSVRDTDITPSGIAMAPWDKARFDDSEHPNDAGYKIMGDTWWTKMGDLLR